MCWNDPQNSGKHFSLVTFPESESESCSVVSDSLRPQGLFSPWNSPGQNTGVGSLSLLQGIFPTQELSWGLLHCRRILYQLSLRLQCSITSGKQTLTRACYGASHHSVSPHAVTTRAPHLAAFHKGTPTSFLPPLPNPWQLLFCSPFP